MSNELYEPINRALTVTFGMTLSQVTATNVNKSIAGICPLTWAIWYRDTTKALEFLAYPDIDISFVDWDYRYTLLTHAYAEKLEAVFDRLLELDAIALENDDTVFHTLHFIIGGCRNVWKSDNAHGGYDDAYTIRCFTKLLNHSKTNVNILSNSLFATPLVFAIRERKYAMMDALLAHQNIDLARGVSSVGALHNACNSTLESVERILAHKHTDVNVRDVNGCTPLHNAVSYNKLEIVKRLLAHPNIDVNVEDGDEIPSNHDNATPLMYAAAGGDIDMITLLVAHGGTCTKERTTLHIAVKHRRLTIVKTLLARSIE